MLRNILATDRKVCAHNRLAQKKPQSAPPGADKHTCSWMVLPFPRTRSADNYPRRSVEWERRKQEARHTEASCPAIEPDNHRRKGGGTTRRRALQRDRQRGRASNPFDPTLQIAGRISSTNTSCNVASMLTRSPTDDREKLTSVFNTKTSRMRLTRGNLFPIASRETTELQRSRYTDVNVLN